VPIPPDRDQEAKPIKVYERHNFVRYNDILPVWEALSLELCRTYLLCGCIPVILTLGHVAECRERLQTAIDTGTWVEVISPIRAIISRLHMKVRQLGVELGAVYKTGYVLQAIGPNYQAILSIPPAASSIRYFLRGFLPSDHVLAYNPAQKMLSYLSVEQGQPHLVLEAVLTLLEERVLLPVFEAVPSYCAIEILLANYIYGKTDEESLARAHQGLEEAKKAGLWDYTMRPLRNAMSRARLKVSPMGVSLPSILETGYMAMYVGPQLYRRGQKGGRHG